MNIANWLKKARNKLKDAGISTAQLDAEVLLADAIDHDRSWIHAHPEFELNDTIVKKINAQIVDRTKHIPIAYIRGRSEFYGREFNVNPYTLQPRPETETMVEMLIALNPKKIIDVGTGSGCIAITAKLELPNAEVTAVDVSNECLKVAQCNATNLMADISIKKSNLIADIPTNKLVSSTLCCNLPYVPDDFHINTAASHEPKLAIFGGKDGLDCFRQLFLQIGDLEEHLRPSYILTESLPSQHDKLAQIALSSDYHQTDRQDFIQVFVYDRA